MFHKVVCARPLIRQLLFVSFDDGALRLYDVSPLTGAPPFDGLDDDLFQKVRVDPGGYGISWSDDIDLSAEELYEGGHEICVDVVDYRRVVDEVAKARRSAGVSQDRLAAAAGLKQPAIARLERGTSAPQIDTVLRVLAPLGKTLRVVNVDEDECICARAS